MRIIIIGAGEVGSHVAKTLCRDNDVFIIEKNEEVCNRARQLDVQVLQGNGADVKSLNKTIVRVSNPDYIDRPVSVRETIGMDAMVCPELSLASEINQILSIPEAINVENFVGGKIKMMEFKVGERNQLIGNKLSDSNLPECCLMPAIFRGSKLMIPHGDDIIQKDDRVVLVGKPEAIEDTRKLFDD